jgi:hypothetical protein
MKVARKLFILAGLALCLLVGAALVAGAVWPPINDVRTGATPEYPDLQPQTFGGPPYRVYDAALAAAREMGWEVVGEDRAAGELHAVATVPVFRFKDDVTVTVKPDGERVTVNVRSRSRVGRGDLGVNARRIRRFQAELAKRL